MESAEFRALEAMVLALLTSLLHEKLIDPKAYEFRVKLAHMLMTENGDQGAAVTLLAHIDRMQETFLGD